MDSDVVALSGERERMSKETQGHCRRKERRKSNLFHSRMTRMIKDARSRRKTNKGSRTSTEIFIMNVIGEKLMRKLTQ